MIIDRSPSSEVKTLKPQIYKDHRGFFTELMSPRFLSMELPGVHFVQDNLSVSQPRVLRGLHFQSDPAQGKLVTCLSGRIFDVAIDVRKGSPSFGKCHSVELSGDEIQWFWVPPGFAHGFCVLGEEPAKVLYKVTGSFNPRGDSGILWNDADLQIPWPVSHPVLSEKDQKLSSFRSYEEAPVFSMRL
ncbi:MAG: dTDP-4-dehydrorhamnose 3,5-epimerase [Bdellovibrio sp.]